MSLPEVTRQPNYYASTSQAIARIVLSGGWDASLDEGIVNEHVAALEAGEKLPPIIVDWETWRIVDGRHRLRAHMLLGLKRIEVLFLHARDQWHAEEVEIRANLCRRQLDPAEARRQRARLVAIAEERAGVTHGEPIDTVPLNPPEPEQAAEPEPKRKRGGQPSPRRQAIKEAAAAAGVSERTIERAVKEEAPAPAPVVVPLCLDWRGRESVEAVETHARRCQVQIAEADKHLRALTRVLGELEKEQHPGADDLKAAQAAAAYAIRRARPVAACPYCNGAMPKRGNCYPCMRTGWFSEQQMAGDIPRELLEPAQKGYDGTCPPPMPPIEAYGPDGDEAPPSDDDVWTEE